MEVIVISLKPLPTRLCDGCQRHSAAMAIGLPGFRMLELCTACDETLTARCSSAARVV